MDDGTPRSVSPIHPNPHPPHDVPADFLPIIFSSSSSTTTTTTAATTSPADNNHDMDVDADSSSLPWSPTDALMAVRVRAHRHQHIRPVHIEAAPPGHYGRSPALHPRRSASPSPPSASGSDTESDHGHRATDLDPVVIVDDCTKMDCADCLCSTLVERLDAVSAHARRLATRLSAAETSAQGFRALSDRLHMLLLTNQQRLFSERSHHDSMAALWGERIQSLEQENNKLRRAVKDASPPTAEGTDQLPSIPNSSHTTRTTS